VPAHHYIPQFYLQGFTDPDTPKGQEPYLWIHEPGQEWRRRAPSNVAAESGYYDFTDADGCVHEDIEQILSRAEDTAARIIRGRVLRQKPPTRPQRAGLAVFIALLHVRVPVLIEHIQEVMAERVRTDMRLVHEVGSRDPQEWKAFKQEYRRRTGEPLPDDATPDLFDPRRYEISTGRPAAIIMALRSADIWKDIAGMDWTFFESKAGLFITSDFPVSVVSPRLLRPDAGLMTTGAEVAFPFSRNIALVMSWQNPNTIRFLSAHERIVEQVNRRTALRARLLMAPKRVFPGSADITAQRTEVLPVARPRIMRVDARRYLMEVRQPSAYPGAEGWLAPLVS
jgi:hypothetical protein